MNGPEEDECRKWFDPSLGVVVVKVLPGEHYVSSDKNEMIVTVLGSCVAACVWDSEAGVGGMNHFMLPDQGEGETSFASRSLRYGSFAMESLLNGVLRAGGRRERLQVKLFGGANVLAAMGTNGGSLAVGLRNSEFARRYAATEGLQLAAADLGGDAPRRIHFYPRTGTVKRLYLRKGIDRAIVSNEMHYDRHLRETQIEGGVELFG